MSIAAASVSIVNLLEKKFIEKHDGSREAFTFRLITTAEFPDPPGSLTNTVSLFLYRVDVDPTRRHVDVTRTEPRAARRLALGLDLRYILTVWAGTAELEHSVLGDCMEILDRYAIVSGDLLASSYAWEDGDALKVSLESISNEDMLRLWDSFPPSYHLSAPYLVRTVRLTPVEHESGPPVESRTNIYVSSGPAGVVS